MAQLTANQTNTYETPVGILSNAPVKASTEIFLGSAVGYASVYARQLVANDIFAGFADQHVNNAVATDGAATIPVVQSGRMVCAITSAAVTDINKAVYMSDGATFTYTSTSNTLVGRVVRWIKTGSVVVEFNVNVQAAS